MLPPSQWGWRREQVPAEIFKINVRAQLDLFFLSRQMKYLNCILMSIRSMHYFPK